VFDGGGHVKIRDNLRQYLTTERVSKCWRCGKELTHNNIGGTSGMPEIECPTCGFIVLLHSRNNKLVTWIFIGAITAFAVGFSIALLFIRS